MTLNEFTPQLLVGLLGGGIASTLLNAMNSAIATRDSRRLAFLQDQLQHLYGPLFYLASQNRMLIGHSTKINSAYKTIYCDTNWSPDEVTQKSVSEEASATIRINNLYWKQLTENNDRIVEILAEHFRLVELEDIDDFQDFILANARGKTEFQAGRLEIPHRVFRELGDVASYNSVFVDRIQHRFEGKRAELASKQQGICWRAWQFFRKVGFDRKMRSEK